MITIKDRYITDRLESTHRTASAGAHQNSIIRIQLSDKILAMAYATHLDLKKKTFVQ